VIDYLKLFTFLSLDEIESIAITHTEDQSKRLAQRRLARDVVSFVHGEAVVAVLEQINDILFGNRTVTSLEAQALQAVRTEAPVTIVPAGTELIEILITAELATSKREAREFIENGAVAINDNIITAVDTVVSAAKWGNLAVLRRGKKNRAFIELS
jgi:tyrosyl-tRNA synthetase